MNGRRLQRGNYQSPKSELECEGLWQHSCSTRVQINVVHGSRRLGRPDAGPGLAFRARTADQSCTRIAAAATAGPVDDAAGSEWPQSRLLNTENISAC
jgi:hypothetical protein